MPHHKNSLIIICFTLLITGCEQSSNISKVKTHSKDNFIFVNGGSFTMGDFGHDVEGKHYAYEGISYNEQFPHQVKLNSFSLSKYKITWFEYDTFLLSTNKTPEYIEIRKRVNNNPLPPDRFFTWGGERPVYQQDTTPYLNVFNFNMNAPAIVQWQNAKDYCNWLGKQLDLTIDLPTEAQWEYAARSRGYEVLFANQTADFNNKPVIIDSRKPLNSKMLDIINRNNLKAIEKTKIINPQEQITLSSIATLSTPNRLGFYDMDINGEEWVNDWYSATYFKENLKITNPQGPAIGDRKVIKAIKLFVFGRASLPTDAFASFRCVVNQQTPVN